MSAENGSYEFTFSRTNSDALPSLLHFLRRKCLLHSIRWKCLLHFLPPILFVPRAIPSSNFLAKDSNFLSYENIVCNIALCCWQHPRQQTSLAPRWPNVGPTCLAIWVCFPGDDLDKSTSRNWLTTSTGTAVHQQTIYMGLLPDT